MSTPTCIVRPEGGIPLCRHPEVRPTLQLPAGAALPERLTYKDTGALAICPECVVVHITEGHTAHAADASMAELLAHVTRETKGLPGAEPSLIRYAETVSAHLSEGRASAAASH